MARLSSSQRTNQRPGLVLAVTILGSAVIFLDGSVVNLALPKLARSLHAGLSLQQWTSDGYLLTLSALILLGGSLGDLYGRKRVYLTGLVGFGLASLGCAVAPDAPILIAARIVQGATGALVVPGSLAIINTSFEPAQRAKAIGSWTAWTSTFFIVGPLLGGIILDVADWRWIFLLNLPLVAICVALAIPTVSESKDPTARQLDLTGALLIALALAGVTYGLIQGPAEHWPAATLVAIGAGLLFGVGFILQERKARYPMVRLDLFRNRNFSGANLMTLAMYGALSGFTFALAIFLQTRMHYSSLAAGMSLLPVSIVMFLFARRAGQLAAKIGPRLPMTAGPLTAAVGMAYLYFLKPGDSYWLSVLPGALIFSGGLVLTVAPLTNTVMASVDPEHSGIASGINNALSRAAGLIVIAVLGLLGSGGFYHFAMALCAALALTAGATAFALIDNASALG